MSQTKLTWGTFQLDLIGLDELNLLDGALAESEPTPEKVVLRSSFETIRMLSEALKEIRNGYGGVCEEFEICTHRPCRDSHGAWAIADSVLRLLKGDPQD